jgi:protein O-GlcNAc transferase
MARGYVTFGSFNRAAKVQDAVLRSWAAILRALPTARLIVKGYQDLGDGRERARIGAVLGQEGIAAERVMLRDRRERIGHFEDYREIDIALDPFPHGGGMTTLDALWMGVPVVTFAGRTISSRLAAASLTALGLDDFIAPDRDAYVDLAVAKAADLATLARLRASLRRRMADAVIGDPKRYAKAVGAAYREIWRRWCRGERAREH